MNAKPEHVPCPNCGGPCTKIEEKVLVENGFPFVMERWESLVKGKVVAKGWAWQGLNTHWLFTTLESGVPRRAEPALIVIKKENSMIQGGFG